MDKVTGLNNLTGKKLGVLLTIPPEHPKFPGALELLQSGVKQSAKIYLYCVDDGVMAVADPEIQKLKEAGVHLFGCAYGAGKRGLVLTDQAAWSGLTILSDILGSTDHFLSF